MKYIGLAFIMLLVCQSAFSQSKKEQIEALIFQKDSLIRVIDTDRQLNTDKVKELETKISKINSDLASIQKELAQSKKELSQSKTELAEKKEEILEHQLDQVSQEKTLQSLRKEINHIKSSEVPSSNQVKIGNQVWINKNLDVDKFRNGDPIPQAQTAIEWIKAGENGQPAWCYFDNDPSNYEYLDDMPSNGEKFGKLYNWYAVNDPRGLAPFGWHVPSDKEWRILRDYLGGEKLAAAKMKSRSGWADAYDISEKGQLIEGTQKNGNGTNESRFSALPSGGRRITGTFTNPIGSVTWWSTSEYGSSSVIYFALCSGCHFYQSSQSKTMGFSVRTIKD